MITIKRPFERTSSLYEICIYLYILNNVGTLSLRETNKKKSTSILHFIS